MPLLCFMSRTENTPVILRAKRRLLYAVYPRAASGTDDNWTEALQSQAQSPAALVSLRFKQPDRSATLTATAWVLGIVHRSSMRIAASYTARRPDVQLILTGARLIQYIAIALYHCSHMRLRA